MQRLVVRNSQMQIPTMAKLCAALWLAFTGFFAAQEILPNLPDGVEGAGVLPVIAASFGLLIGWRVVGLNPGRRWHEALNDGLRGAVYMMLWSYGFLGVAQMLKLASRMRYRDIGEATIDIVGQAAIVAQASMSLSVAAVLIVGAAFAGLSSEWAHRRFGR
ncbi:TrgA family protein [Thioclava sp. BHET1]|nr:TrgA family protein [Thioclava sp. BHET1]